MDWQVDVDECVFVWCGVDIDFVIKECGVFVQVVQIVGFVVVVMFFGNVDVIVVYGQCYMIFIDIENYVDFVGFGVFGYVVEYFLQYVVDGDFYFVVYIDVFIGQVGVVGDVSVFV